MISSVSASRLKGICFPRAVVSYAVWVYLAGLKETSGKKTSFWGRALEF
jgi:hypothetical protein